MMLSHRASSGARKTSLARVEVCVLAQRERELLVGRVQVALRIGDLGVNLRAPLLVTQREKPQENQRQDVTLVVGRLDIPAQRHRRVPKLLEKFGDAAVSVLLLVEGFLHARVRRTSQGRAVMTKKNLHHVIEHDQSAKAHCSENQFTAASPAPLNEEQNDALWRIARVR